MTAKTKMNTLNWKFTACAGLCLVALAAGCTDSSNIQKQQKISRADYGDDIITQAAAGSGIGMSQSGASTQSGDAALSGSLAQNAGTGAPAMPGAGASDKIAGTWEFTTPPTVSRTKKSTEQFDQFALYASKDDPTDTPMLVITTGTDLKLLVEAAPDDYKVIQSRTYLLNGLPAKEYNGYTKDGKRFCELLVASGKGAELHAMAIAKDVQQAKTALNILASITWKPNK